MARLGTLLGAQCKEQCFADDHIAHFALKAAQPSVTGFRLEYFFWRIMGSQRLQQVLTESQIARIHAMISQDNPIRTTPRQTPVRFGTNSDVPDSSGVNATLSSDGRFPGSTGRRNLDVPTVKAHASRDRSTSRPPRPILRTPGIDTVTTEKSARIVTPTWGGHNGKGKGKLPLNEENFNTRDNSLKLQPARSSMSANPASLSNTSSLSTLQSAAASPKPALEGSPSKAGRKGSFAVGSKRRRPAMPHRRSSQSASSANAKSPKQSPVLNQESFEATTRSTSERPSGLQQITETSTGGETAGGNNKNSHSLSSVPNLRTDNSSQNRSEGNLKLAAAATNFTPSSSFNNPPSMRAIPAKATLSTGVSLITPVTANLQPFADPDQGPSSSSSSSLATAAAATAVGVSPTHTASGSGSGPRLSQNLKLRGDNQSSSSGKDTLQRSRDNLNLLLERDRRKASGAGGGPRKGKKT